MIVIKRTSVFILSISLIIIFGFVNNNPYGGAISNQIIFILIFFFTLLFTKRKKYSISITGLLMFILSFNIVISTLRSPLVDVKINMFTFLIYSSIYIILGSLDFSKDELKFFINAYIFTAIIGAFSIFINFIMRNPYRGERYSTTFFGVNKDPNYASAFIVSAILLLLLKVIFKKNIKSFMLLLFLTIAVMFTGSRSAFLFLMATYGYVFILYIFNKNIKAWKKIVMSFFVVSFLIFGLIILYGVIPVSVLVRYTDFSNYDDNIRLIVWERVLEYFTNLSLNLKLFGAGLESSNVISIMLTQLYTHNIYIDILYSVGITGSLIFMMIILRNIFMCKKGDRGIVFGLALISFGPLFFINGFNTPSFWTPLILINLISINSKRKEEHIIDWY